MTEGRFKNKTVIVSGGGTGIGKACAVAFAREDAYTIILGRREQPLKETIDVIVSEKGSGEFYSVDVSSSSQVNELMDKIVKKHGKIDTYVANASVVLVSPITETTDDDVNRLIDINVKGNYYQLRKVTEVMKKQGFGSIVTMSSMSGKIGHPGMTLYCSTKAAILNMTRALALELATSNIRVNAVCPGTIDTPMPRDYAASTSDPEKVIKTFIEAEPMKRLGLSEEVAPVVLFLASDEASFVTGSAYDVDGGFIAGK